MELKAPCRPCATRHQWARESGAFVTAILAHSEHEVVNSRAAWVPKEATKIIDDARTDFLAGIEARFEELRASLDLGDRLTFQRVRGRVDTDCPVPVCAGARRADCRSRPAVRDRLACLNP